MLHLIVDCNLLYTNVMLMRTKNKQRNEECYFVTIIWLFQNTSSNTSFIIVMSLK